MKNNVTLCVRIPKEIAVSILGRLYAGGHINRAQYQTKVRQIDKTVLDRDRKKVLKLEQMLAKMTEKQAK